MSAPDILFGAGDLAPVVPYTLRDRDGNPVDLTGATVVVRFRDKDQLAAETTETVAVAQTVDPATLGTIAWTPSAPAAAGEYNLNWIATLPGAKPETFPPDRYLWMSILPAP